MASKRSNFEMQKMFLRVGGISLRENDSTAYKIFSMLLLTFICAYPFLAVIDVFRQDFETVAELIKYEITFLVAVIKVIVVQLNRVQLRKLLDKIETGSFLKNSRHIGDKEEELIKQCSFIATTQTMAYWWFTFAAYSSNFVYSLLKRIRSSDYHDWKFTYGSFQLINATYSPNFEILWGYQSFSCFFLGSNFVMTDATMAGVLCHVCFELKILQSNLRCIVENSYREMLKEENEDSSTQELNNTIVSNDAQKPVTEWKYIHQSLKRAVEYHLAIVNIVSELNETFSNLLLMTFLGTMGMLTFMVYRASVVPLTDYRLIVGLGEIIVIILQVLIVCFWSEQMLFEGKEVGTAAYEANFVGTDVRLQKALALIMRRSQTPLTLGAGKFIDISLATFLWIIRSAYSVFTVLRNQV